MGGAVTEGSRVCEAVARRDAVLPRVGQLGMDESGAAGHAAQAWEAAVAPCMPIVATGNKLVASRNNRHARCHCCLPRLRRVPSCTRLVHAELTHTRQDGISPRNCLTDTRPLSHRTAHASTASARSAAAVAVRWHRRLPRL